jgi:hypothetical protein
MPLKWSDPNKARTPTGQGAGRILRRRSPEHSLRDTRTGGDKGMHFSKFIILLRQKGLAFQRNKLCAKTSEKCPLSWAVI